MTDYVLSIDAGLDLDEIWEYIAADSVEAPTGGLEIVRCVCLRTCSSRSRAKKYS